MSPIYPIFPISAAREYEASVLQDDSARTAFAMENAGKAIGEAIHADFQELGEWPQAPHILVLAGKGLNAGDAFIACSILLDRHPGLTVTVVMTADDADLNPLASKALSELRESLGTAFASIPVSEYLEAEVEPVDVVLDGLYGLGFKPPLREKAAALLKQVNARTDIPFRAAVDIPSGIGEEADPDAFVADFTYIPGVAKEPCFRAEHEAFCGRLRFLEIEPFRAQPCADEQTQFVLSPHAHKSLNRLRPPHSDKRTYGHCLILAGSARMPGAAVLATRGALQAGAGLVTTLTPANVATHLASAIPEAMWRPLPLTPDGGLDIEAVRNVSSLAAKAQAILIGPGMMLDRSTVYSICRIIRETPLAIVLDASALTQDVVAAVMGRPLTSGPVVITPHRGEYARILGMKEDPGDNKGLLAFTKKYRVITVLKGSPTIICDGQRLVHAPVGGPVLARGGAGDILAGMILTLLAQDTSDPFSAALKAVSWHGAAADSLARSSGSVAVRTTDLLDHLAPSLRS
jgi:NAD(P)H-hydrate epimerase